MELFCYLDSDGKIGHTNLQLYSLKMAAVSWNDLVKELLSHDSIDDISYFEQRLVFIVNCFGLSLSQLLGQNWPSDDREKIATPGTLLGNILRCSFLERAEQKRLNKGFNEITATYDAIRHFGKAKNDAIHKKVKEIDLIILKRYKQITIDIWNAVISVQRSYDVNKIEDFRSIDDKVLFEEMPERIA